MEACATLQNNFRPVIDEQPLLTEAELAEQLNVEPTLLERLRFEGSGPPFVRVSARIIRYRPSAVRRWLDSRTGMFFDAGDAA